MPTTRATAESRLGVMRHDHDGAAFGEGIIRFGRHGRTDGDSKSTYIGEAGTSLYLLFFIHVAWWSSWRKLYPLAFRPYFLFP